MSPGKFPVASCFSRRFSKISKWDWLRLLSLPASVLETLHTTFKAKFLLFTALWLSCMWALMSFRPDILRIYLPSENPEARKPNAGFKQLSPWGEFLQLLLSSHFQGTYLVVWSWLCISATPIGLFTFSCGKIFSTSPQVFPINISSVNSYNFDVVMEEVVSSGSSYSIIVATNTVQI